MDAAHRRGLNPNDRLHCRLSPEPVDVRDREINAILARDLQIPVVGVLDVGRGSGPKPVLVGKVPEFAPGHVALPKADRERAASTTGLMPPAETQTG